MTFFVVAQADCAPPRMVEQRLSEGFHGFHEFDRILPGSLNTRFGLTLLRGSAIAGDFGDGKEGLEVHVDYDTELHARVACGNQHVNKATLLPSF